MSQSGAEHGANKRTLASTADSARLQSLIDALQSKLALASHNQFAQLMKIGGLAAALRNSSDAILQVVKISDLEEFRDHLDAFDASSEPQRRVLVARGLRIVRTLSQLAPVPQLPAQAAVRSQHGPVSSIPAATRTRRSKAAKSTVVHDPLAQPTTSIKGIGATFAALLAQSDITSVEDLLWHMPTRYDNPNDAIAVSALQSSLHEGKRVVVFGKISLSKMIFARGQRWADIRISDDNGLQLGIRFFHAWTGIEKKFPVGHHAVMVGVVKFRGGGPSMANPDVLVMAAARNQSENIVTYYPKIAGVPGARVKTACLAALAAAPGLLDEIPLSVASAVGLPGLAESVTALHQPPMNIDASSLAALQAGVSRWHQRLAFGELFTLAAAAVMQRMQRCAGESPRCAEQPQQVDELEQTLGFRLTDAQRRAVTDISNDLGKSSPMNRLLEGDVGSGKTAVAFAAALQVARAGQQVVIMAPTEVLAEQHERNMRKWGQSLGISVALLTASTPSPVRHSTLSLAAAGALHIVIGTHSVLAETVGFARLGLVVIDEQQRFGVAQRARLRHKGSGEHMATPHLLVMTATPIPRTLALTAFGDLDRTVIDELPPGRAPIVTATVKGQTKAAWLSICKQISQHVVAGHQVYVVCPKIAHTEGTQAGIDAESVHAALVEQLAPHMICLVHGKQSVAQRDQSMRAFRDGVCAVMVATTVIEVGVDNPNATLMVVMGADRFGLSQLHQLRGRVGRGTASSQCLLATAADPTPEGVERMAVMVETTDGFRIAERDLQLRGPGELFGEKQAGAPRLAIGDFDLYLQLLRLARQHVGPVMQQDPQLEQPANATLRAAVLRRLHQVLDGGG